MKNEYTTSHFTDFHFFIGRFITKKNFFEKFDGSSCLHEGLLNR